MSFQSISEQLLSLTEETKEHAMYLQELGVVSFERVVSERRASISQVESCSPHVPGGLTQTPEKPPLVRPQAKSPTMLPPSAPRKTALVAPVSHTLFGNIFEPPEERLPESAETFDQIWSDVGDCTRCPLSQGRTNIVHTEGNRKARLMFVGEAPGADEDAQARPFVGRAGQLLTKIIEAIGFKREEVLIGNVNRCRPPGNRAPTQEEVSMCKPFLLREIAAARPDVIVVLGNTAMRNLLETKEGITRMRGQFQNYKGVKVMPTFHPAYLLRDPSKKRESWEDLKKVRSYLDGTSPDKS